VWAISRSFSATRSRAGNTTTYQGRTQLQGMAGVVDVFAGAGKVPRIHWLSSQFRPRLELGLDPILHRLDVVVGGLLNRLDGFAIGLGEVFHQTQ